MAEQTCVLYLSGTLPTRSETFVYREIFALRELDARIETASVHTPGRGLGDPRLHELAVETTAIYARGPLGIGSDAVAATLRKPFRSVATLALAIADAAFSKDVRGRRRLKVLWQCVAAMSLAHRVRDREIGHVHAHMAHVPTTIGMYASRQLGVGFSFTGHANDLFPNRTLLAEKLRRAVWVNCISDWHRSFYQSIVPRAERDYPIVRCGVDTRSVRPVNTPRGAVLEVLGVGRLVEKKGFDALIVAAGRIAAEGGPAIRVRIAGSGPEEPRLRTLVDSLPPGARVELLGDTPNDRVLELMTSCDVFVLPCRVANSGDRDGIPVVLMEAMALGRCVVSGNLETIRELIEDKRSGLMVSPGDPEEVAHALRSLANDRGLVENLGRCGRERVESEFDVTLNAKRILLAMADHGIGSVGGVM